MLLRGSREIRVDDSTKPRSNPAVLMTSLLYVQTHIGSWATRTVMDLIELDGVANHVDVATL